MMSRYNSQHSHLVKERGRSTKSVNNGDMTLLAVLKLAGDSAHQS